MWINWSRFLPGLPRTRTRCWLPQGPDFSWQQTLGPSSSWSWQTPQWGVGCAAAVLPCHAIRDQGGGTGSSGWSPSLPGKAWQVERRTGWEGGLQGSREAFSGGSVQEEQGEGRGKARARTPPYIWSGQGGGVHMETAGQTDVREAEWALSLLSTFHLFTVIFP